MPFYASSSYLPHIYAYVKAAGVIHLLQELDTSANYLKMLVKLFIS